MVKNTVSGYRKICDGFKLGVAGFGVLLALVIVSLVLSGLRIVDDSSKIFSIFEVVRQILPIVSMIVILNGIVEVGADTDHANKAKMWFAIRLILCGCAMVVSAFSNLINERFYSDTNFSNFIFMFLYIMITSIGDYILYYLSYIYLMREYENVVSIYGFEEKTQGRIRRSEVLLTVSSATLIISETCFFIYTVIVVGLQDISKVNRRVVLLVVAVLSIALIIRAINYVMMLLISGKIAKELEEISH